MFREGGFNPEEAKKKEEESKKSGFMSGLAKKARGIVAAASLVAGGEAMAGGHGEVKHGKETHKEWAGGQQVEVDDDGLLAENKGPDSEKQEPSDFTVTEVEGPKLDLSKSHEWDKKRDEHVKEWNEESEQRSKDFTDKNADELSKGKNKANS